MVVFEGWWLDDQVVVVVRGERGADEVMRRREKKGARVVYITKQGNQVLVYGIKPD